ncbi:MAG: GPO family capsid scaffolding protein [Gammaproteobacteria bacterium]|nr:GPO family capsid scaffolding protein [Gammaproteobacteria bacterium]
MATKNAKVFRRVAVEGQTIDGRELSKSDILDMAETYDPKVFGARIWPEHYRGFFAGGYGDALGDITEVKAEIINDGTALDGKYGFFVTGDALPGMKLLNDAKQKIFSSVEIIKNFCGTGKTYFAGIAATDSPASRGTEILAFSATNKQEFIKFDSEEVNATELFSAFNQAESPEKSESKGAQFFSTIAELFKRRTKSDDERFSGIESSVQLIAESQRDNLDAHDDMASKFSELTTKFNDLANQYSSLLADHNGLKETLSKTPEGGQRGKASGGNSDYDQTNC